MAASPALSGPAAASGQGHHRHGAGQRHGAASVQLRSTTSSRRHAAIRSAWARPTAAGAANVVYDMSEAGPAMATDNPRSACLNAARAAEREYDLPHGLLVAVALAESGLHAYALNLGGRTHVPASFAEARRLLQNNRGRSAMIGCVQVNAAAHARGGQDWPLDPVVATEWAARTLRFRYEQTGDWGQALHIWQTGRNGGQGATPGICRVRAKLDVVAPNSDLFSDRNCGGMQTARIRRSGRALLELAEAPDR